MKRVPGATYRLQFNRDFTFSQAGGALDYLAEVGITDIYASPLFRAGPQSTHGYDVCSFNEINPGIGSPEDFDRFTAQLKSLGLGLLLDMVPNHMGAALSNPWWVDVLKHGRDSRFAGFFDINWELPHPRRPHKILLPVLEDHYGKVLESGKLRLVFEHGEFFIAYGGRNFPVDPATLPVAEAPAPGMVAAFNGRPGEPHSFDRLDALLRRQHYRLAHWRVGGEEINYRRFFDIAELVSLRMESPEVFQAAHKLVFEWLAAGKITGLRIDHPDGLWNPKEYFDRLQFKAARGSAVSAAESIPPEKQEIREAPPEKSLYIVVEKILSDDEQLPVDWAVDGSTGYDFLNRVNGLFVDTGHAADFDRIYRELAGGSHSFPDAARQGKTDVLDRLFRNEVNGLSRRLHDVAARTRDGRDCTLLELRRGLLALIAAFPVYRTYITETSSKVSSQDRAVIQKAVQNARASGNPPVAAGVLDFIGRVLQLEIAAKPYDPLFPDTRALVMKIQQLTGPVTAKGLEDTAFYRFNRLVSLNEVGGDPGKFGVTPDEFHETTRREAGRWPHTLLASATHDTKHGEDVRARLNVLSEMPDAWRDAVTQWFRENGRHRTEVAGQPAPSANDEYLLYQILVGAWPLDAGTPEGLENFRARVTAFMLKAIREAKLRTSWTDPDAAYEAAVTDFIARLLTDISNPFFHELHRLQSRIAFFGRFNSLAQTLFKMTCPGVPDFYQGTELWDLSLVDPDNRRPVDYAVRREMLADVKAKFEGSPGRRTGFFSALLRDNQPGAIKLFLIWMTLNYRRAQRDLFDGGDYVPLSATGPRKNHVVAFARKQGFQTVIVIVPRLILGLTRGSEVAPIGPEVWHGTLLKLPAEESDRQFHNVLTEEPITVVRQDAAPWLEMAEVLKNFPVALLVND